MRGRAVFVSFMVDKVEIKLGATASFTRPVFAAVGELRSTSPQVRYRKSKEYAAVLDLREVTNDNALLHLQSRNGGTHKIELLDTGEACKGQMVETTARIVNEHPEFLELGRVDLCANVEDVTVSWFAKSVRASWSQWQATVGEVALADPEGRVVQWSEMGRRVLQTMYLGKRPNCFRVYDKIAERRSAYRKELARHLRTARALHGVPEAAENFDDRFGGPARPDWNDDTRAKERAGYSADVRAALLREFPFPSFEEWFSAHCTGGMTGIVEIERVDLFEDGAQQLKIVPKIPKVLTRVERQMAAGRVPQDVGTFHKLFKNGREFNPFDRLKFNPPVSGLDYDPAQWSLVDYAAGETFRRWIQEGHITFARLYALANVNGNGKRWLDKFGPCLAGLAGVPDDYAAERSASITPAELFEQYRDTFSRQLAA